MSSPTKQPVTPLTTPSLRPALPIGDRVIHVLDVAYRARRPVLLEGPTGIGKSQIVAQFAERAGIDCRVLDLSLLEPPDLIGLPQFREGRTHYACPAELPTSGNGVLMLEELNRAEIPVMQPALQLLSARRLHAYELPPGWSCIAAINPESDEYQVNRLDDAMRSRFLELRVRPDRDEWLAWARRGNTHPTILHLVATNADVFATSSPRSWSYLSQVLRGLRPEEIRSRDLVLTLAHGYLPVAWATAVAEAMSKLPDVPQVDGKALLGPDGPAYFAALHAPLQRQGRSDAIVLLAWQVKRVLTETGLGGSDHDRLALTLAPLPGDLREQCLAAVGQKPA